MNNKQKLGYLLEEKIHKKLLTTKYVLLNEKEIVRHCGHLCYGVDHLLITHNEIICIQDKWRDSKPSLPDVNHFIKGIENIIKNIKNIKHIVIKRCIGIYISKEPFGKYAKEAIDNENKKLNNIKYFTIDSICMDLIIVIFSRLIHGFGIYFYENDGDVIMQYN